MNKTLTLCAVALALTSAWPVSDAHAARDSLRDNLLHYQVGGGRALKPTTTSNPGLKYNAAVGFNLSGQGCSTKFDPQNLLDIQFNMDGIKEGFLNSAASVVGAVKGMIANAPLITIQRAHPELYDLIIQGMQNYQADLQFFTATCDDMVDAVADMSFPADKLVRISGFESLREKMNYSGENPPNVKDAVKSAQREAGKKGVVSAGGVKRGGENQEALSIVEETARSGYNMQFGRPVEQDTAVAANVGKQQALWAQWKSPKEASEWLTEVVGETSLRTCEGCQKTVTKPGKGLVYLYNKEHETAHQALVDALSQPKQHLDAELLDALSSPSVRITQPLIDALRAVGDSSTLERLASEIGMSRTLEKSIMARRLLVSGRKEANLANNDVLQQEIDRKLADLDSEVESIMMELEIRSRLNGNTPQKLLMAHAQKQREEAEQSAPSLQKPVMRADGAIEAER